MSWLRRSGRAPSRAAAERATRGEARVRGSESTPPVAAAALPGQLAQASRAGRPASASAGSQLGRDRDEAQPTPGPPPAPDRPETGDRGRLTAHVPWRHVVAALGIVVFLFWVVPDVILIVFAGCLIAVLLDAAASFLARRSGLPRNAILVSTVVSGIALAVLGLWTVGPPVGAQLGQLQQRLPEAVAGIQGWIENQTWFDPAWISGETSAQDVLQRVTSFFTAGVTALGGAFLVFLMGVYLALAPHVYVRGAVLLVPCEHRARAREVLAAIAQALRWWFVGRLASMLVVGVLTGIGLTIIGLGQALALAVIAALFTFVPYLGPITAAVPALLVASTQGLEMMGATVAVYVVVQLIDDNVATPLIQERAVDLPPAVLIAGQILMASLFGLLGVLLASPFIVAVIVAMQMLYVEEALDTPVKVLGEED